MTTSSGAPIVVPHETLDQAAELGLISPGVNLQEIGSIGDGPDGAADVVWYTFSLEGPALVHFELSRQDATSSFNGVLSLFNNDPYDSNDPYDLDGHRLIERVDGKSDGGVASFDQLLGQGTYDLAVSGDGNFYFNPLIADSGVPGSTGGFNLQMSAADAGLGSATGPQVLTSDPAPGATLSASPLAIRVDLSGPLDPSTAIAGQTVQLLYSPDGNFVADGQPVSLASMNFSPVVEVSAPGGAVPQYQGLNELQLFPASPLIPGDYEVVLSGHAGGGSTVLADPDGNDFGADAAHPLGQDITIPFQVDGIEGRVGASIEDDTMAGAQQLGDLTGAGLVQIAGAIGDDPGPDTSGIPGNQVDLYHFTVTGTTNQSLVAEVFAGRIGSPLTPGLSLYRLDPTDDTLVFVAGDINSYNPTQTTDGLSTPLYTDSVLYASLTPGEYYIAVAGNWNTPSPVEGEYYLPGAEGAGAAAAPPGSYYGSYGLYDPNDPGPGQAGSPQNGWSTGPYVLNLLATPAPTPPHVVSTSPVAGSTLTQPPTQVVVTFDQPMNINLLALQTYQATFQDTISGIYVEAADGTKYFPRFDSYDSATNQATFDMLDALPDGGYQLHISASAGLTDLGGNPLVGNDPNGDYVVSFYVDAPPRGDGGNPLEWSDQEPNDSIAQPQVIGVLFPNELSAGVDITRDFSQDPAAAPQDTADVYQFQVTIDRTYSFSLNGIDGNAQPAGVSLSLLTPSGQVLPLSSFFKGTLLFGELAPGTYDLMVSGWDKARAPGIAYQVVIGLETNNDNAPALVAGPAPAVAIQLDSLAPPTTSPSPPVVTPPATPPTVTDPQPVTDPPTTDPSPVAGPPPVESPSGNTGSSGISTPAAAAFAIATPQVLGGPSGYGVTSTDVVALAASPMGGVIAPGDASTSGAMLAQSNAGVPQSSMVTGLVVIGTSLHMLNPGDDATSAPVGPEGVEELLNELRDRGVSLLQRSLAVAAGIGEKSLAIAAGIGERSLMISGGGDHASDVIPGVESIATPPSGRVGRDDAGPPPDEARSENARSDRPRGPAERARVVLLAVTGLALGTYARCRGLLRKDGRHDERRSCPGPGMGPHRSPRRMGAKGYRA